MSNKPNTKPRVQSKTLAFNLLVALMSGIELHFKMLEPFVDAEFYQYAFFFVLLANIVLRELTTQALEGVFK